MVAAFKPGSAAGEVEMRKRLKYERLGDAYIFEPVAIKTTGVYGPSTAVILKLISHRLVDLVDGRAEGACVAKAKAGPSCPEGQCFQYSLSR